NSYDSDAHMKLSAALPRATRFHELAKAVTDLDKSIRQSNAEAQKMEQEARNLQKSCEAARKSRSEFQKTLESDRKRLDTATRKYGTPDSIRAAIDHNKVRVKQEAAKEKIDRELERAVIQEKENENELREIERVLSTWKEKLADARNELDALKRRHAAE